MLPQAAPSRRLPAGARELLRVHDPQPEVGLPACGDELDALENDRRFPVRPGHLRPPDGLDPPALADERSPERQELLAGRVREVRRERDARQLRAPAQDEQGSQHPALPGHAARHHVRVTRDGPPKISTVRGR